MKKFFFFALTAIFAIDMMAQDETYPKFIDSGWDYTLKGVKREYVTSKMLREIVALECEANKNLTAVAQRWLMLDPDTYVYVYDTIARYEYKDGKKVLVDDGRLDGEDYKDVLWNVYWDLYEAAPEDTVKIFRFNYYSDKILDYYVKSDTSYTAYAGLPYLLNSVSNPLQLSVTYSSSDGKVASVDEKGQIIVTGKGECMIKALFAGDEDIKADSAEWKLVVKEGDHFILEIISKEMTEETWVSDGWTYHWKGFGRIQVTEQNCNDIYGDGKISFDIPTRTLTFNNYQRTYSDEEDSSMGWTEWLNYQSGPLPLNIKIIGDCAIRHNSAGFMSGWDMNIIGESGSKLTLEGRFPQLSAHQLWVSGCEVHAFASTPHPLMMCEILRVDDNSFFESKFDMENEMGPDDELWMYGALAIEGIKELILGEHMALYPKGASVGEFEGRNTILDADGKPAMSFYIDKKDDTALEQITDSDASGRKFIRGGQLLIIRGGKTYTVTGQELK